MNNYDFVPQKIPTEFFDFKTIGGKMSIIDKRIKKKCIKAFLEGAILAKLQKDPLSGYEILHVLAKQCHYDLNPSVIYSQLYALERVGLIRSTFMRRGRIFELTTEGTALIENYRLSIPLIKKYIEKMFQS